jgi:primosomal protein N' (replication factor Y) (superfamily II helicase)
MVQSRERKPLHIFIKQWLRVLEGSKDSKKVRWSLDIDPMDLY